MQRLSHIQEEQELSRFSWLPIIQSRQKEHRAAFPPRRTGYVAFMQRHSRRKRLLIALSLLLIHLTLLYFTTLPVVVNNLIFIVLVALFPEFAIPVHPQSDPIRNMPAMLHREDRNGAPALRLGMEEAPLAVIKEVALGKRDETYGFIDFPYTSRIASPLLFPVEQVESVRQWLQEHVPELEIIE